MSKIEAKRKSISGSWTIRKGLEVAIMFEGLYSVGIGMVVIVLSPKPTSRILIQLLEYHNAFADLKLPFPMDELTYIKDCWKDDHMGWF